MPLYYEDLDVIYPTYIVLYPRYDVYMARRSDDFARFIDAIPLVHIHVRMPHWMGNMLVTAYTVMLTPELYTGY